MLAALLLLLVIALRSCGGDEPRDSASAIPALPPRLRAQLPGGGRRIFPDRRVVAFYGAPQSPRLGILGIGDPDRAAAKLERVARSYERKTRPVLPGFELIATIANADPGDDGLFRTHQSHATIERYLLAARRAKALLLLDIQPGRGDFLSEAKRLERWLREPEVGLALDPEWHVGPGEVPGKTIGSVKASQINAVSSYLSDLVQKHDLPEKLFVIHQFTQDMIEGKAQVRRRPGLAVTMNVDGFGTPAAKISKYDAFTAEAARFHDGFKLFYEEDSGLMSPAAVLALGPPPDLVIYE
ncbi:MAG: hypothetical protein H0W96_04495 [Solirubrobacterales bacterium]|nr:hypothetical protein [Solirubrobacterales bacterium]